MLRWWLALLLLGLGCSASQTTARIHSGRWVEGELVSEEAYAYALEGALRFRSGDSVGAERAYRRALDSFGESPALRSRLGQVLCSRSPEQALAEFNRAHQLDPTFGWSWLAHSRCLESMGRLDEALRASESARRQLPNSSDVDLHHAGLLSRLGKDEQARWTLFTASLRSPERALLQELGNQSQEGDPALAAWSARQRKALTDQADSTVACTSHPCRDAISAVLDADREQSIEDLIRHGQLDHAEEVTETWLLADPRSVPAHIFALWIAHLRGDSERFESLLQHAPRGPSPPVQGPARQRAIQLADTVLVAP